MGVVWAYNNTIFIRSRSRDNKRSRSRERRPRSKERQEERYKIVIAIMVDLLLKVTQPWAEISQSRETKK